LHRSIANLEYFVESFWILRREQDTTAGLVNC